MSRRSDRLLRLYMVKGSFFTAESDGGAAMDAAVWSKLPDELIWEVLRLAPAATHFRLQLVSRKWREVLTSARFRNTMATTLVAAAAATAAPREAAEEERVIACASPAYDHAAGPGRVKAVDIDLSSFVPSSFWASHGDSYCVEAAADGLVLISSGSHEYKPLKNDREYRASKAGEETRYCVLNPLTRTCKVLPEVPFKPEGWLPLTPTAVTMFGWSGWLAWGEGGLGRVATCDLIGGGAGVWDVAAAGAAGACEPTGSWVDPVVAQCRPCCDDGDLGLYSDYYGGTRCQVLLPRPDGGRLAQAGPALDPPAVALLGVGASLGRSGAHLGAHLGAAGVVVLHDEWRKMLRLGVVMCVWRLARGDPDAEQQQRLDGWEEVARLDLAEVVRLTGVRSIRRKQVMCHVWGAWGARNLLYCTVSVDITPFVVGLNMDTGEWERLDDEHTLLRVPITSQAFQLRPDLFL